MPSTSSSAYSRPATTSRNRRRRCYGFVFRINRFSLLTRLFLTSLETETETSKHWWEKITGMMGKMPPRKLYALSPDSP
jgi:hypothetical protein